MALINETRVTPDYVAPTGVTSNEISTVGVRYSNGDLHVAYDDLGVGLYRYYSTQFSDVQDVGLGYNWQLQGWPSLAGTNNSPVITFDAQQAFWFDLSGGDYSARYGASQTLESHTDEDGRHLFKLTDTDGTVYEFYDFSYAGSKNGHFFRSIAPSGDKIEWSQKMDGSETLEYTAAGQTSSYQLITYRYVTSGENAGRLQSMTLQRRTSASQLWDATTRQHHVYSPGGVLVLRFL